MTRTITSAQRRESRRLGALPARARLSAIVETADLAIIGKDPDGIITDWNPGAERLYGYTAHEAVGRPITILAPPGRAGEIEELLARLRRGEAIPHHETLRRRKDGSLVAVFLAVSPILDRSGRFIGSSVIARDISELAAASALVADQKQVLELMVQDAPLPRVLDELARTIESRASRTLCASILLLDEDSIYLHHGAAPSLPATYTTAIDGTAIGPCAGSCGTAAYRKEPVIVEDIAADPLWANWRDLALRHGLRACWSTPILRSDGGVAGTFALYYPQPSAPAPEEQQMVGLLIRTAAIAIERSRAAAERDRLLAREQAAREQAEAALRIRDALMSFATHDLRTPLTTLKGQAQMMRRLAARERLTPDLLMTSLAGIEGASRTMEELIGEILDSVRLQAGQQLDLRRSPTDLVGLARRCTSELQQTTAQHVIRVETDVAALVGDWDTVRLERVLGNLLTNAIKYSPAGGSITVMVAERRRDGDTWAEVTVRDEGVGIPATDLPHIFERFHRAANVTEHIAGSGIGLAGARQIVEQHGGTLTADSTEGEGSAFTMYLPVASAG
jgi:PAS domain S-box-containing protein